MRESLNYRVFFLYFIFWRQDEELDDFDGQLAVHIRFQVIGNCQGKIIIIVMLIIS